MKKQLKRYVSKHAIKKDMKRKGKDQPRKPKQNAAMNKMKRRSQKPKVKPPSPDIRSSVVFSYPKGNYPRITLAGNSNVGKSSIAKRILSNPSLYKAKIGKTPGSTIKLNLINDKNQKFHLIDLPGLGPMVRFSKKEQSFVQKQIIQYFEKDKENLFLTLVIANILRIEDEISKWHDSNPNTIPLTFEFIQFLEELQIPCVLVLNKIDKVSKIHKEQIEKKVQRVLNQLKISIKEPTSEFGLIGIIYASARTAEGISELKQIIQARYKQFLPSFEEKFGALETLNSENYKDMTKESELLEQSDRKNQEKMSKNRKRENKKFEDEDENFEDEEEFEDEDENFEDEEEFEDEDENFEDEEEFEDEDENFEDEEEFEDEDENFEDEEEFEDEDEVFEDEEDFEDEDEVFEDEEDFEEVDNNFDEKREHNEKIEDRSQEEGEAAVKKTKKLDIVSIRRQKLMLSKKRNAIIKDLKKKGYSMHYIKNYLENPEFKKKMDRNIKKKKK